MSRKGHKYISSYEIRSRFINFFKSKDHLQIKSSSVSPFADSTLEFTNAGMNQFKNVFLGLAESSAKRTVNSQKCIRVGGKHNDLNVVGHDSYHHTFFEMLGNWSFGDYFKKEACSYALELVTSPPYSLPLDRLYFTYFNGDKALNLPPDIETKHVWQQLGVNENRIIGFGLKDNFWEMGQTGPCGPCTEIHFDHVGSELRPHLVNKDLPDLTELWNLVFIQFKRLEDGSLSELSQSFVDTGMGLERLVALLQGKMSNYDTDLFSPLFDTIVENSEVPRYRGKYGKYDVGNVDTKYRILADHSRMIAVALSDYVLPDYCHSLRRVIRKSLLIADELSPNSGLPLLLKVVETAGRLLGDHFPQIISNMDKTEIILLDEMKLFAEIRKETQNEWKKLLEKDTKLESLTDCQSIGLIQAYKFIKNNPEPAIPKLLNIDYALTCYDRYGLNLMLIEQLAAIKGYTVNNEDFFQAVGKLKKINKTLLSQNGNKFTSFNVSGLQLQLTDEKYKFSYVRDKTTGTYSNENLKTTVLKAWMDGHTIEKGQLIPFGIEVDLLLRSTNFHSPMVDHGKPLGKIFVTISSHKTTEFEVSEVYRHHGYIIHRGTFLNEREKESIVYENWNVSCSIYMKAIEPIMRHTSAAVLLNSLMKSKFGAEMTYLNINTDLFTAKFNLYGQAIGVQDAVACEDEINRFIMSEKDLVSEIISSKQLLSDPTIAVAPYLNPFLAFYQRITIGTPSQFSAVTTSPNVLNSKDISEVCLTRFNSGKRNRECTIVGTAGPNIKERLSHSTLQLISALKCSTVEIEKNEFLKKVKKQLMSNVIPLELHNSVKNSLIEVKSSSKI